MTMVGRKAALVFGRVEANGPFTERTLSGELSSAYKLKTTLVAG